MSNIELKMAEYMPKICRIATEHDPEKMANLIYFFMKQDNKSIFVRNVQTALKYLKQMLIRDYGWSLVSVHTCISQIKTLTQYFDFYA